MKHYFLLILLGLTTIVSGCATVPQPPVNLTHEALNTSMGRIGVAMTALPKIDTAFPGADCLLCLGVASLANGSLTNHTKTFTHETLPELKSELAELLKKNGKNVLIIEEDLDLSNLKKANTKGVNVALKNYSPMKEKYSIDKLLIIDINRLGFIRPYASYIPMSDPKGYLHGTGYIVNLSNNTYEWYLPVDIAKSAEGDWNEPPTFPGLTNAYFQVVEIGRDAFLSPFLK